MNAGTDPSAAPTDLLARAVMRLPRPFRRWWSRLTLGTQLSATILVSGVAAALGMQALVGSVGATQPSLVQWGLVLATVLGVVLVTTRLVTRTLRGVVDNAQALVEGHYEEFRALRRRGGSAEVRQLEHAFDALATAIAEREQILQSEMLQMREVERIKDEFVSTVSHELRTPLTSVRGALGLVMGGPMAGELPPKARELLRIALQNSERLIRLINDILDIEKMEAGQMAMHAERTDLAGILRTTVAGLQAVAHDAGVRVAIEGEDIVPVMGDPDRLVQIFMNLASNAIKFSPRGEEVRIKLETKGTMAIVHVTDRGPGIAPEFRERIFGKFQQADSSALRKPGGTGLGLAIARAITEMHDGTIRFETAVGAGTTFTVELPCLAPAGARTEPEAQDATHVLIVEQDESMRSILAMLCASLGRVDTVGDAADARVSTRETAYDAIVMDPDLPDGSGFDLVRELRDSETYRSTPVLLFSAREYSPAELENVTLAPSHAFVKSRDRETDIIMRLRAILAVRRHRGGRSAA